MASYWLASSLLPLLELAAAAEHAVLPMLAVLELAVTVLPVLELAAVVASVAAAVASMSHHASHVSTSHVSTSHVPTVTATRNLVCSIGHSRSSCTSSEHAAHAAAMAATMTCR